MIIPELIPNMELLSCSQVSKYLGSEFVCCPTLPLVGFQQGLAVGGTSGLSHGVQPVAATSALPSSLVFMPVPRLYPTSFVAEHRLQAPHIRPGTLCG